MASLSEALRSALQSIRAHGLRSFLTALGIIIGVASVVAVVSIVEGLSATISGEFRGLGANGLTVAAHTPFEDVLQGRENVLGLADYHRILAHLDGIRHVAPSFAPFGAGTQVRHGSRAAFTQVLAVTRSYGDASQIYPSQGRFIAASDNASRRRVCVIGSRLQEKLRLPDQPLGRFIDIGGEWFRIVGVAESRGEAFGFSRDDYVVIPFASGLALAGETRPNVAVALTVDDIGQLDAVQGRIVSLLRQAHRLQPGQPNDFKVQTARQLSDTFENIVATVTVVLAGIVGISLLVGGVGIMNIMLVSVTERTREIGICKALGARRHHILLQFLVEAVLLSLLGGLAGLALGCLLGQGSAHLIPGFPPAVFPWWAVLLALGFSSLTGIVFGIVPAARAARLDAIEALRHE